MEAWQLMAGLTALLIIYAVMATVLGVGVTPLDLVFGVVFGSVGLYVGQVLSKRLNAEK